MKIIYSRNSLFLTTMLVLLGLSCKKLSDVNKNPNGVEESSANPNLIMSTVVSEAAKIYNSIGYQDLAGVVQHTQKDAWFTTQNNYEWGTSISWTSYYHILRNDKILLQNSVKNGMEFHYGVGLVMRAFMYGLIADLWGDAPCSKALSGNDDEYITPEYDSQYDIYKSVLSDLDSANKVLSKETAAYTGISSTYDVMYGGDPQKWRKFANSLALRYYMRLSVKVPEFSKTGIEKIAQNPASYPVMSSSSDDAAMSYIGTTSDNSWPSNTVNSDASGSNFRRLKMCSTLTDSLKKFKDPRIAVWAAKVQIPIKIVASLPAGSDYISNGIRYVSTDKVSGVTVDTSSDYVGLPPAVSSVPSAYNLNPTPGQTSYNPHVSFLNDTYKLASGGILKARLLSAAEVDLILAEATLRGWNTGGDAATYYANGINASLTSWGVASGYADYVSGNAVKFDGTIKQVILQKWINSWTSAAEAWFDYRRTGYPVLTPGPSAIRQAIPLRFYYPADEQSMNDAHLQTALANLVVTQYSQSDGKNSAWSKFWLLQDTGYPY